MLNIRGSCMLFALLLFGSDVVVSAAVAPALTLPLKPRWSMSVSGFQGPSATLAVGRSSVIVLKQGSSCDVDALTAHRLWCIGEGLLPVWSGSVWLFPRSNGSIIARRASDGSIAWSVKVVSPDTAHFGENLTPRLWSNAAVTLGSSYGAAGKQNYFEVRDRRAIWHATMSTVIDAPRFLSLKLAVQPVLGGEPSTPFLAFFHLGSQGGLAATLPGKAILAQSKGLLWASASPRVQNIADSFLKFHIELIDASSLRILRTYQLAPEYETNYALWSSGALNQPVGLVLGPVVADGMLFGGVGTTIYRYELGTDVDRQNPEIVSRSATLIGALGRNSVLASTSSGVSIVDRTRLKWSMRVVIHDESPSEVLDIREHRAIIGFADGSIFGVSATSKRVAKIASNCASPQVNFDAGTLYLACGSSDRIVRAYALRELR